MGRLQTKKGDSNKYVEEQIANIFSMLCLQVTAKRNQV